MRSRLLHRLRLIGLFILPLLLLSTLAYGRARAAGPAATVIEATPESATPESMRSVSEVRAAAEAALAALGPKVERVSDERALEMAFTSYYSYRAARPDRVRKPYLYYVDFGLDNRTPRGYVFDMDALTVIDGPFTVSHGSGSSRTRNGVPTTFSNRPGSKMSSLGLYLAQETYTFRGRSGGRAYTSVGLRMGGESGEFNDAARRRGIVAHGAPYVTARDAGRSSGCPAMEQRRARRLLPMIANGGVVYIFSPHDREWLSEAPWARAEAAAD